MIIHQLEERIECMTDAKYIAIIELIIEAVRDYPVTNLVDTNAFFGIVKASLGGGEITSSSLEAYIDAVAASGNSSAIWIVTSLTSLLEAFRLMQMYGISFDEVVRKIGE